MKVGDRVRHDIFGDGTIEWGPDTEEGFGILFDNGKRYARGGSWVTPIPPEPVFAVGDEVMRVERGVVKRVDDDGGLIVRLDDSPTIERPSVQPKYAVGQTVKWASDEANERLQVVAIGYDYSLRRIGGSGCADFAMESELSPALECPTCGQPTPPTSA